MSKRTDHSRLKLLRTNSKALCHNGHGVQEITDAFSDGNELLLQLACGCRRREGSAT